MVPREAGRGRSFVGAGKYYLHDKGALTDERVGFTHTENLPTNDPHKALKWMAWTAIHAEEIKQESGAHATGRPCERPVFTFSLAWHPEQEPEKPEMIGAGRRALIALGLQDHETVMVSHKDRDHPHLHVIVNVIHPETGKASRLAFSRTKLSAWAEEYEREHGKIYCDQRVENNAKRKQGENVKYREAELDVKEQIAGLYRSSDSGEAFRTALAEQGFTLARGKRIVLIDREGKIHSLSRQLDGIKASEIRDRLAGLELPDIDSAREQIGAGDKEHKPQAAQDTKDREQHAEETEPEYFDRDRQDQEWHESIIDAAIAEKPEALPQRPPRRDPSPLLLNALQDRHLGELGSFHAKTAAARRKLEFSHEQQYGGHEGELRRDITHLEGLLNNSGAARRLFLRMTGQIPKDAPQELENMRRTLENIEQRKAETSGALDAQIECERRAIEARHAEERTRFRPAQDDPAREHVPEADGADLDPGEEEFGPSFEY